MLELPKRKDFHETTIVEFSNNSGGMYPLKLSETIQYRKGFINMRNIVDVFEMKLKFEVIDEEKLPEYEKVKADWIKKHHPNINSFYTQPITEPAIAPLEDDYKNSHDAMAIAGETENIDQAVPQFVVPPPIPKKVFEIPITSVIYFNGVQRMMVDDLKEFSEMYFDYLQAQKLDIN